MYIGHVRGFSNLPFQIVITSELEGDEYAAYRALTNKASEIDIERVVRDLEEESNDVLRNYYGSVLNRVSEKNPEIMSRMRRDNHMKNPALMKIFEEDFNAHVAAAVKEQVDAQLKEKVDAQVKEKVEAKTEETSIEFIINLMNSTNWSVKKAMDNLSIPQSKQADYAALVAKRMS